MNVLRKTQNLAFTKCIFGTVIALSDFKRELTQTTIRILAQDRNFLPKA